MKKSLILGILISIVFLYLAVRKVNFSETLAALQQANYWYMIPNILFVILGMWIRAVRWKLMINPIKKVSLTSLFRSTLIGFMAINLLPARIGEFVKAYSLGKKEKISKSATLATIALERIFDLLALLVALWFTLVLFPTPDLIKKIGNLTLLLVAGVLLFLVFLKTKTNLTLNFLEKIFFFVKKSLFEKFRQLIFRFVSGLAVLDHFSSILWIMLISLVLWFATALSNYFIFLAFDLHPPIYASFILLILVILGVSLPSSPGFIGTFQLACVLALSFFKIDKSTAFSFSIILWLCNYVPVTLLGLYYFRKEHFSLKQAEIMTANLEEKV